MYEWDPAKAKSNQEEHGVDFADAVQVLDNPYLNKEDTDAVGDQVFVALGTDNLGRFLVVVYTYREDRIRLISARKATRKEGKEYARRIRF
ncbi:MAG: BrnT family toxin [Deltaproteobacteria bacterium]|nr:BrnT family toxin [Deltaproteobacteria bacterium]